MSVSTLPEQKPENLELGDAGLDRLVLGDGARRAPPSSGADRAEYGAQTLKKLSAALKERIGRGFSVRSLELFRRFFLQFEATVPMARNSQTLSAISAATQIPQTPSAKSAALSERLSKVLHSASAELLPQLPLG